jgi:excisionase family DNA binding protein
MLSKAVHDAKERGYVTANELADKCGVHRTTVSLAMRHGKLKSTKIGNVCLVSKRDADEFMKQYTISSAFTPSNPKTKRA